MQHATAPRDPRQCVTPQQSLWLRHPCVAGPVVVSIPHFGVGSPRRYAAHEFASRFGHHLAFGFADDYAADLYGDLHEAGAQVIGARLSRLFVDVNRPRDDYQVEDGRVYSRTGVVRTHSRRGRPIFARAPEVAEIEQRLRDYYDPYHARLAQLVREAEARHGHAVVLDMHTASARRMGRHEVVLGTRDGQTAAAELVARTAEVFAAHDLDVALDVSGYRGAHVVRSYGARRNRRWHAIQVEVNAGLLHGMDHDALVQAQIDGQRPTADAQSLAALRRCMAELVQAGLAWQPA